MYPQQQFQFLAVRERTPFVFVDNHGCALKDNKMTISLNPIISFSSKLETKFQDASRYSVGASFAKATPITPFSLKSRSKMFVKEKRFSHCFSVADSDQLAADSSNKDISNAENSPAKNDQLASINLPEETVQLQAKSESKTSEAGSPKSQSATARTSLKMRERIRAARVLSGYDKEPKAAKSEMGSGVLSALKESEKGMKKRSGLPEAPSNIFDDSKRGMPKEGLTFDFPGGSDLFFIGFSFVFISTVMFATTYIVWKLGAIHFNEY